MQPGRELPSSLRRMVEAWVEVHEGELLEQWQKAQEGKQVTIVG